MRMRGGKTREEKERIKSVVQGLVARGGGGRLGNGFQDGGGDNKLPILDLYVHQYV